VNQPRPRSIASARALGDKYVGEFKDGNAGSLGCLWRLVLHLAAIGAGRVSSVNRASQRATAISPVSSRWRITILRFGVSAICKNRCSAVARIEHAEFGQCTVTLVPFFTEAALLPHWL